MQAKQSRSKNQSHTYTQTQTKTHIYVHALWQHHSPTFMGGEGPIIAAYSFDFSKFPWVQNNLMYVLYKNNYCIWNKYTFIFAVK